MTLMKKRYLAGLDTGCLELLRQVRPGAVGGATSNLPFTNRMLSTPGISKGRGRGSFPAADTVAILALVPV